MPLLLNVAIEVVATRPIGCRSSLCLSRSPKSRDAAKRAMKAIRQGVKALSKHPEIGRPVEEFPPEFREWVIEFGNGRLCRHVPLRRKRGGHTCCQARVRTLTGILIVGGRSRICSKNYAAVRLNLGH